MLPVVASLIGIPGYESISDDLRLLASHNSKIERYTRLVAFLDTQNDAEPPSGGRPTPRRARRPPGSRR